MPGLWMSPESLKELRLTFKASTSPLEKWPGACLGTWFMAVFPGLGTKVAFLKDGKEGTSRHFGVLKNLRNPPELVSTSDKARWQLCGLALP